MENIVENETNYTNIVIAAGDSSAQVKKSADYVCTGENDHETIQTAIDSIKDTGGIISLTEGTIVSCINGQNVTLTGTIRSDDENPVVVSGTDVDISSLDITCLK
jgi:pectin methylesterase-like acyl-CoA thioesterase